MRGSIVSVFLLFSLSLLWGVACASKKSAKLRSLFEPSGKKGKLPTKVCVNIGSWFETVGPFHAELGLIKYLGGEPGAFTEPAKEIADTVFDHAFLTQRSKKDIRFKIVVAKGFKYKITLGFAEVQKKFCKPRKRVLDIKVGTQSKSGVDVFSSVGCDKALFVQFTDVMPNKKGSVEISVKAPKGNAILATLCVERGRGSPPGSSPGPSQKPKKSKKPKPSASPSRKPKKSKKPKPSRIPGPSRQPRPSRSPFPSRSPRPSRSPAPSSPPVPSRSPRPNPTLVPSTCQQADCSNFEGPGDYVVIGNSGSNDEDRDDCSINPSSSATLSIPSGARIKKAYLYWSASGQIFKNADARLNGHFVGATKTFRGGASGYSFYGAVADVTGIVHGAGSYIVSNIWYDNRGLLCFGNAAYAAWSMVVVYERADLPKARINVCYNDFTFTFPAGTYTNHVGCIQGSSSTRARTTVVAFEGDAYKGEHFFINNVFKGNNLFRGSTAPNLDIRTFDILPIVKTGVRSITYTIKSFFVQTRFGGAVEGLVYPLRVTYHTINH